MSDSHSSTQNNTELKVGPKIITITIDGRDIEAEEGQLLIRAAIDNGVYIPHFCWHPRMKPVAMCRLCLVEVEGIRGLPPACTTKVTDGMVVHTATQTVFQAQQCVLEFLLINHPLDCPVCDKGGECPLQDQTMAFGPGESRYVEEKRHFEKPIPISPLVLLDRERCILCARCTRFAEEIAGDPLISFVGRGNGTQVLTFPDEPFSSYFSGNTVEICPVGALTAVPYRFAARPWDLEQTDSSCIQCSVGCRISMQSSSGKLVRFLGIDSDPVNQGWLCDKGRFSFEYANSNNRVAAPLLRVGDRRKETSWSEALDLCAERLEAIVEKWGPRSVAVVGGAKSTNESAYAFARLARGVIGTPNVDAQMGDGVDSAFLCSSGAGERASISDLDSASCVVLAAPDLKEELPVLYLRVRQAAVTYGVPVIEVSGRDTSLTPYAHTVIRTREGEVAYALWVLARAIGAAQRLPLEEVDKSSLDQAIETLEYQKRPGKPVIVVGRDNLAAQAGGLEAAAVALAKVTSAKVLPVEHRGNILGAYWSGLSPTMLPGARSVGDSEARARCESMWGHTPSFEQGADAVGILQGAATGEIKALILLGADPLGDFPDQRLARKALDGVEFVLSIDALLSPSAQAADVVLPAAAHGEHSGSFMNLEGRIFWNNQKVRHYRLSRPEWYVAQELAERFGDCTFPEGTRELFEELARCAGVEGEVSLGSLALASTTGDGVLLSHRFEPYKIESEVTPPPAPVQYAFRLVATRQLYGNGVVNNACEHLSSLGDSPAVRLSPRDMDKLGITDGDLLRLTNGDVTCVLPARRDVSLSEGSVGVTFNQDLPESSVTVGDSSVARSQISTLIECAQRVTEVRVETVKPRSDAQG